jgi:hypothetical protein
MLNTFWTCYHNPEDGSVTLHVRDVGQLAAMFALAKKSFK